MKYLCLAYEEEAKLNALTHSEWDVLRRETLEYVDKLRRDGVLLDTRALQSADTAVVVNVRDRKVGVTDGPFAESKEQLGGYFLIDAANLDEAIRIAADWPSARIGDIEVRPVEEELRTDRRY